MRNVEKQLIVQSEIFSLNGCKEHRISATLFPELEHKLPLETHW